MAVVSKTNRDGIDVVIENLQQKFYSRLLAYWNGSATYESYPRANKINDKRDTENVLPKISLDEKDYQGVLTNDKFDATSFWLIDDSRIFDDEINQIRQSISFIIQADLVELYGASERYDEQFNMDVLRVVKSESKYIYGDIEIEEGVDNVYSDLNITGALRDKLRLTDISQFHVLKVTFDVIYKFKCNR
jgi:hypothetical protein